MLHDSQQSATVARPLRYHEMLQEITRLHAISDCTSLSVYGETSEGRQLVRLTISSAENLARIEAIRRDCATLDDSSTEEQAHAVIARMPVVVWMGFGIHGDELSCSDAALEIARRLIAGRHGPTRELLENLIIHLDPMVNPDGRERCLSHVMGFHRLTGVEDPQDILHSAFWPGGRGSHYLFDLNRDAIFTIQRETQARVAAILAERPQLLIDAHEIGPADTFLFASPAQPLNPHLPRGVHDSWAEFAVDHAASFDRDGTSYYTRAWNEVFFPGFFDIWPAYHGAVPILYEQGATSGVTVRLPNGSHRTYATAIDNHVRSAFANLATAVAKKDALLLRRWSARHRAPKHHEFPGRTWLILPSDTYKAAQLLRMLRTQGIEVEQLDHAVEAADLHSYGSNELHCVELPAQTLRVRAAQPLGALVRNMLDCHVPMADDFLEEERRRLDLGAKTRLYDVTAWALPLAFAAEVYWTDREIAGEWREVAATHSLTRSNGSLQRGRYGYIYTDPSQFATMRLLARGIPVRVARARFVHDGTSYEPGTLLIRNDDHGGCVTQILDEEHARGDACFVAADSARILSGPDLGGDDFDLLRPLSVAVLTGALTDAPCSGALWHLFDVSAGVPVTLLDLAHLDRIDLSRYRVLILPSASDSDALAATLKHRLRESLQTWIEAGGTLIALGSGASALVDAGLTVCKLRRSVLNEYPPLMFGRSAEAVFAENFIGATGASGRGAHVAHPGRTRPVIGAGASAESSAAFSMPGRVPTLHEWLQTLPAAPSLIETAGAVLRRYLPSGAYLRAQLKPSHWLRYGVPPELPVLFRETDALIADSTLDVAGRFAAPTELALSGLVWPEAVGYIAGTAYLVRERRARGQVILFSSDPVFRGYSLGTQRLLLNAVILGSALGVG